ncbi:TOBE domain-containing protein [Beggiatoa leptomitoformis]|uniref:Transporter n=1 Tax=Beggiatoa leptomitoformis TaxID=288004 RepID=A0A2N9YBY8_9GAMM|nr:TOBE domain-containing protein [Beggiatoa leptomitoformis]ALG66708.1 transporter [Beggiatoa leptomitoformis]AUI67962.1 transporter [Beggiatoa leptomitoformis]
MQISARNKFVGKVSYVKQGQVDAEVGVKIAEGFEIVAQITQASVGHLGLAEGVEVSAFVKYSNLMLMSAEDDMLLSARNQLLGTVVAVQSARISAEIVLSLLEQFTLKAFVSQEAVEEMGLKVGDKVYAVFKAGSVILGKKRA